MPFFIIRFLRVVGTMRVSRVTRARKVNFGLDIDQSVENRSQLCKRLHIRRIANLESYVVLLERVAEPCNKIMVENKRRRLAKQAAHDVRRQSV